VSKRGARQQRVADFDLRMGDAATQVVGLQNLGRYIAVNPMADQTEQLQQLGIAADSCTKVDLYWHFRDDVWFIQVQARSYAMERAPGIYARRADSGYLNVVVVLAEELIASATVAAALGKIASHQIPVRRLDATLLLIAE
jgi:hypothetical protein